MGARSLFIVYSGMVIQDNGARADGGTCQRNDSPGIVARQVLLPSVLPAATNGKPIFAGVVGVVGALVFSVDTNIALLE